MVGGLCGATARLRALHCARSYERDFLHARYALPDPTQARLSVTLPRGGYEWKFEFFHAFFRQGSMYG